MRHYITIIAIALAGSFLAGAMLVTPGPARAGDYDIWGTQKTDALGALAAGARYREFTPSAEPSYQNIIMNYILMINKDLSESIAVVRVATRPEKDLLFINGKLYSVTENFGAIARDALDAQLRRLSSDYGSPVVQADPALTTYTFTTSATKVIVYAYPRPQAVDCRVYFYSASLFKMLMSE
ncbi:MAG: hypothetical protein EPN93_19730 [Spirochaetes bacterium]|nr:MAG: hypothetical protein EPN93_19730 [Spirochaetota bacterium]